MKLTLVNTEQLEGDVRTFIFHSPQPASWAPGQYLHLTLKHSNPDDRGDNRWFTISAAPSDGNMAISTRIVSDHPSSFKQALAALKPGDEIEAEGPEGDFTLGDPDRNYIFVAGGIGITPFHSIIKEAAAEAAMPHITLLYANRTTDITFQQELDAVRATYPNLTISYILAPQKIDKDLLQKTLQTVENPLVYVSGPEPMVEAFVGILDELGVVKENLKTDYFPGYEAF